MIQITKLNKHYKKEIFSDLELIINNPSINLIIGESGSGKSTLLNIIYQIDNKYHGDVNILDNNEINYGNNISLVNQSNALIKRFTALDNVLIAQSNVDIDQINYYATKLKINEILNKKVKNLSAGEKQRVAILKAIINKPNILLLDEPTSHLDTKTTTIIIELLEELKNNGMIIVITTHDYRLIEKFNNVYQIKNKKLEVIKYTSDNIKLAKNSNLVNNNILKYIKMNLKTQKIIYLLYITIITIAALFFIGSISNFLAINDDYNEKIDDLFQDYQSYYVGDTPSDNQSYDVYYYGDYIINDYYLRDVELLQENNITTQVPIAVSISSYIDNNEFIITSGEKPDEVNEIIISEDVEKYYNKNYNDTLVNKEITIIENPSKHDSHEEGGHQEFIPTSITITGTYKTYEYAQPIENDFEFNGVTLTTKVYGAIEKPISNTYQYSIHTTNDECTQTNCVTKENYYNYSDFVYLFDAILFQTIAIFIGFIILFFLMSMLILVPRKKELAYLYSIGITKTKTTIAIIIEILILYTVSYILATTIFQIYLKNILHPISLLNIGLIYLLLAICLLLPIILIVYTTKKNN